MHYTILTSILEKATLYLDPGSGSILIQLLVAALLGSKPPIRKKEQARELERHLYLMERL